MLDLRWILCFWSQKLLVLQLHLVFKRGEVLHDRYMYIYNHPRVNLDFLSRYRSWQFKVHISDKSSEYRKRDRHINNASNRVVVCLSRYRRWECTVDFYDEYPADRNRGRHIILPPLREKLDCLFTYRRWEFGRMLQAPHPRTCQKKSYGYIEERLVVGV